MQDLEELFLLIQILLKIFLIALIPYFLTFQYVLMAQDNYVIYANYENGELVLVIDGKTYSINQNKILFNNQDLFS